MVPPSSTSRSAPGWSAPAIPGPATRGPCASAWIVAAIGVTVLLAYLAGGRHGISASERERLFTPIDAPRSQLALPALDVPFLRPLTASTLTARGALLVALGRRTALRDLAAVASALAIVAFGAWLLSLDVALLPATLAMLTMAAGTTFWLRGVSWQGDALSPALGVVAAAAIARWTVSRRRWLMILALSAAAAAGVEDRAWAAVLPAVGLLLWPSLVTRERTIAVPAMAMLAAASVTFAPAPPFSASFPHPVALIAEVTREFTALGALLIVIGVVVWIRRPVVGPRGGLVIVMLLVPYVTFARSHVDPMPAPYALCGWTAVAFALAWIMSEHPRRHAIPLAVTTAIVLMSAPVASRTRLWSLGRDTTSTNAARAAYDVRPAEVTEGTVFVAESRAVDAALLLSSAQAGRPITIVPQTADAVVQALGERRRVLAFAHARTQLERLGFLSERAFVGAIAMHEMTGRAPCAGLQPGKWTDVSQLAAMGHLVLNAPPDGAGAGGVMLHMLHSTPAIAVTRIEPRSIAFDLAASTLSDSSVNALLERPFGETVGTSTLHVPPRSRMEPVMIRLDARPVAAVATAEERPTLMCMGPLSQGPTLGSGPEAEGLVRMNEYTPFVSGWHTIEADPDFFRWTAAPQSLVRVSSAAAGRVKVIITATPAARDTARPRIGLAVNDCQLAEQAMTGGADYQWTAADDCWHAGVNDLRIRVTPLVSPASLFGSHDTRLLGARIGAIRLSRVRP